ncbi:hypothetical protein AVEN_29482-1 [Araneus ventricosus]|uniref:Tc1-like transposase DDE domain-containing protein n=1 Tax=Araneus ventricosus TaxID=182803 RepID=A0A4Y2K2W4_ARAVE|nr:hypothetical protein AVEN_29482-1 [Araneus ventricosus]
MAAKGTETRVATGDADTYIVRSGLEKATSHPRERRRPSRVTDCFGTTRKDFSLQVFCYCTTIQPQLHARNRNSASDGLLEYPPYSPDLAQSDFHFFGPSKKHLRGPHFRTDAEVQRAVLTRLQDLDADLLYPVSIRWCTNGTNASKPIVTMGRSTVKPRLTELWLSEA